MILLNLLNLINHLRPTFFRVFLDKRLAADCI
jgi:hypothetical protein